MSPALAAVLGAGLAGAGAWLAITKPWRPDRPESVPEQLLGEVAKIALEQPKVRSVIRDAALGAAAGLGLAVVLAAL